MGLLIRNGDPYRIRTDVKGVRGLCLNHLTNGPFARFLRLPYAGLAVGILAKNMPPAYFLHARTLKTEQGKITHYSQGLCLRHS